jgi:hypothetical protein
MTWDVAAKRLAERVLRDLARHRGGSPRPLRDVARNVSGEDASDIASLLTGLEEDGFVECRRDHSPELYYGPTQQCVVVVEHYDKGEFAPGEKPETMMDYWETNRNRLGYPPGGS